MSSRKIRGKCREYSFGESTMPIDDKNRDGPIPETSSTMLRELAGGADSARWTDFVDLYKPVLVYWLNALRNGPLPMLSRDMYDDIVQETLVSLMKLFPSRRYEKDRARFRTLLSSVLRRRAVDCLRRRGDARLSFLPDEDMLLLLESRQLSTSANAANGTADSELRAELWRLIVDRVFRESNFSGQSRAVFMRSMAGESTDSIAVEFGLDRNTIYQIRNRIMAKLTQKARALSRESGDILGMIEALESMDGGNGDD